MGVVSSKADPKFLDGDAAKAAEAEAKKAAAAEAKKAAEAEKTADTSKDK